MSEELKLGVWKMHWEPEAPAPVIYDLSDNRIAAIAETSTEKMLARTGIIVAAPALYEVTEAALQVFRLIAEHGSGDSALAAQDMIPSLESVLEAANFLGPITGGALIGS